MADPVESQDDADLVRKPFFELPLEVRLLIYKHIFSHLRLPLTLPLSDCPSCSILRTCRRICQEAAPVFFNLATFDLIFAQSTYLTYPQFPEPRHKHHCHIRKINIPHWNENFGSHYPRNDSVWRPSTYFLRLKHVMVEQEFCAATTNFHVNNRWCGCMRIRGGIQDVDDGDNAVTRNASALRRFLPWMRAEKLYEVTLCIRFLDGEMDREKQVCMIMIKADAIIVVEGDRTDDRVEGFASLLRENVIAVVTED